MSDDTKTKPVSISQRQKKIDLLSFFHTMNRKEGIRMAFMGILLVNLIFGILSGVFFLGAVCLAIGLIIREKYKLIAKILFIVSGCCVVFLALFVLFVVSLMS